MFEQKKLPHTFAYDRVIMNTPHPHNHPPTHIEKRRNVQDFRFIRWDNFFSTNGREIM
eukprot:Pgem_evm1s17941